VTEKIINLLEQGLVRTAMDINRIAAQSGKQARGQTGIAERVLKRVLLSLLQPDHFDERVLGGLMNRLRGAR
jgi:hypothetical protein